uniref:Molybdenum cofactor synthesis protein 2B n=1 Tax=Oryzias melastigma TaxID=30732 RepID=A0A3B3BHB8_ORYME
MSAEMSQQEDVCRLSRDPLSLQEVVDAVSSSSCGAISVFLGTTREDEVGGRRVLGLHYEAYESMVQSEFRKLCADLRGRWPGVKHICVHHRLGVAMAISSPHRHDGQQAIQHCISQLKARMPIWKKEVYHTQEESWKENSECPWSTSARLLTEKLHAEKTRACVDEAAGGGAS